MADTFLTNDTTSVGITFASDDIAGIHYPRIKLIHGANDTNDGDVSSANPFPVTDSAGAALLTTIDADTSAMVVDLAAIEVDLAAIEVLIAASNVLLTAIDADTSRIVACNTGAVVVASGAITATLAAETTKVIGTVNIAAAQTIAVTNAGTFAVQAACVLGAETTKVIGTVNVAAAQTIAVTNAGTFAVQATLAAETTKVIGTVNIAAAQTVGTVTNLAQLGGVAVSMGTGARDAGTQRVTIATNDSLTVDLGTNNDVVLAPQTSGGYKISRTIGAATTNATSVKASAGQVYGIYVSNVNAAAVYLKLYNLAAAPTVGTDTPVATFMVPGSTAGAGFTFWPPAGIAFATGIAFAVTGAVADADTTAVSANEQVVHIFYS